MTVRLFILYMPYLFVQAEKAGADSVRTWQLPSDEGIHSAMDPDSTVDKHVAGFAQHGRCYLRVRCP